MKKLMLLAAGLVASVAMLAGCNGSAPTLTFAQQVSIACGGAKGEIAILTGDGVFTGGAAITLNEKIVPGVDAACTAGATVTVANVQSISSAIAPLLVSIVKASGLPQSDQVTAVLAIGTIKGMIDVAFPQDVVTMPASMLLGGSAIQ